MLGYIHTAALKEVLIFGICQFKLQHLVFVSDLMCNLTPPHCCRCIINQQTGQKMMFTSCPGSPCAESPHSPWVSIICLRFIHSAVVAFSTIQLDIAGFSSTLLSRTILQAFSNSWTIGKTSHRSDVIGHTYLIGTCCSVQLFDL